MSELALLDDVDLLGARARLRRPRLEDAEPLYAALAGRREILDWIEWAGPQHVDDLREKARHWRLEGEGAANYHLTIARADTGAVAGALSLRFIDHPGIGDVGYWVAAAEQGRGLATDAVSLAAWLAFEVLEAQGMSACVFHGNLGSRRVLEKLGFRLAAPAPAAADAGCATSCGARPRWSFELARATWLARPDQRPPEFELAFAGARP